MVALFKSPKPIRNARHLEFIRSLPCVAMGGDYGVVAHHLLRTPEKAMGRKSGDNWCLPLYHRVHTQLHACGDEVGFLGDHGITDPMKLAAALWEVTGDHERACEIIRCKEIGYD